MMKVLCIDAATNTLPNPLVEGEVYTVLRVSQAIDRRMSIKREGYVLVETELWQDLFKKVFDKNRFIPLSDIDETELVKERENIYA